MYDLGDRLLMVASDRISTYDVVHPNADPRQGQGAHRAVGVLVRARPATSCPTTCSRPPTACPTRCAAGRIVVRKLRDAARRVRRARLHHRLGLEGLPGDRHGLRASSCRPACSESEQLPDADLHAVDEGRGRPRRGDRLRRRPPSSSATASSWTRVRDVSIELYRFAAEHARERGVILADTKFEFGLDADGELRRRRRGADARLARASGRPTATSPAAGSRASTSSTCATGPSGTGWDKTPPAPAIPDDVVAGTRARYVEAYERITGEPFDGLAGADARREGAGAHPAEGRDPRPAGHRRRARAAGARLRGRVATSTSAGCRARRRGPRAARRDVPRSCWPTR